MKANRIPRNFKHLIVESVHGNSAGGAGQRFDVVKDPYNGYIGTNIETGERWAMFVSHLRNIEFYKIIEIV